MLIPSDRPAYRILNPHGFFGPDDHLYREGDCIVFDGEPNEEMEPLNEPAKERLMAYFTKLEEHARISAEKNGRQYTGRPRTLDAAIALASADARRPQLIKGDGGVPIMGADKSQVGIERLTDEDVPDAVRRPRGRPKGSGKLQVA